MTKAYQNFIPQVWSARLLANLDKTHVYPMCVNRDYEGEIKQFGDTVRINRFGDVTVSDYTGTLGEPEEIDSTQVLLTIDKAKSFNFKVEDIEKAQTNVNLIEKAMSRAAYSISDVIDTYLAAFTSQAGIKVGSSSSAVTINVSNAYDQLVDLKVALNKKNVPKEGRFVVVPPEYVGLLEKDSRFTKNNDVLANGVVGKVAGFEIRESNNVPVSAGKYSILAGTDMAISYAGQITEIEAYRPEKSFSDAVKGLYVYGAKVVEPNSICCLTVTFGA
ncbi:P22 phage major capsid protein family protein [Paraclostridium sordellii]|uniref:hypothetical protein n=1 Tax=Paraclostridium sordellii TaxID=1505 RepID=UPI0030CC9BCF